ncbi:MAG: hypothetical protein HQ526_11490 [Actinobacteria bacterium]|nr:hypothetical protein [Actinomycetota bacterium]
MYNLTKQGKVTRVSNAVVAGTTDINSSSIDMQGFDAVTFYVCFGAITASAVTSVKAQQSSDDAAADAFADLLGTGITVADDDDNQVVALEVNEPRERYVRCVVDRGTANAVVDSIIAVQTRAGVEPVTHDSTTVVGSEWHHAPAEGTA